MKIGVFSVLDIVTEHDSGHEADSRVIELRDLVRFTADEGEDIERGAPTR